MNLQQEPRAHFFKPIRRCENEELYQVSHDAADDDDDDVDEYDDRPLRWYERLTGQICICTLLATVLVLLGLMLMPKDYRRGHVNDLSHNGLYRDIESLQDANVHDSLNRTVYGAILRPWELDTSREYYLSREGLWDVDKDPPFITREYTFEISEIIAAPDGVEKRMTVINGKFPGPLIEANEGDRIVVNVINKGKKPTALHFHGLHQRGTNFMDGAHGISQCAIPPGKSFRYGFNITDQYGTYWYHSHYSTQLLDGIAGPVVIHSKKEADYKYDEEILLFMSDLYHEDTISLVKDYIAPGVENREPVPDAGLIQGTTKGDCSRVIGNYHCGESRDPVILVKNDKIYRIRLVSAGGFSEFDFSIDNHTLQIIEADGTSTEPLDLGVVRLSNGQRYSALVKMDQQRDGKFWIRANMNKFCYDADSSHLDPNVNAVLAYPDAAAEILGDGGEVKELPVQSNRHHDLDGTISCVELDAKLLKPKFKETIPQPTRFIQIDASFQIGAKTITLAYFNDTSYKHPKSEKDCTLKTILQYPSKVIQNVDKSTPDWADNRFVLTIPEKQVVDILINNYDDGAHPFHMHGFKFWILDGGKGYFDWDKYHNTTYTNAINRDVFQVDKFGWALVRTVFDNPGVWPLHCHVAWHIVSGMMMEFVVLPDELSKQKPPKQWYEICDT